MAEMNAGNNDLTQLEDMKTTFNLINNQLAKIDEDSKDRVNLFKEEYNASNGAFQQQISEMSNKISMDDSTLQQRVQYAFDRTNGKFKEYFETMMHDH